MRLNLRVIGVFMVLAIFYGVVGYSSWAKTDVTHVNNVLQDRVEARAATSLDVNIDYGAKRAELAVAEYQKGVQEATPGCNCGPEVARYTLGLNKQWCAMFASWVMKEAGTPLTQQPADNSWRIEKARSIASWLDDNGVWYSRSEVLAGNIQPQVGDVIIFWRGDFEGSLGHADIVIDVDPSQPGFADLIGGNLKNKVYYQEDFFYAEHYGFLGFGRPVGPTAPVAAAAESPAVATPPVR